MFTMKDLVINEEALEFEDEAFAQLRELVLEEARRIVEARRSHEVTRDDVTEALRRALHVFLEQRLALLGKKRREGAANLVESWLAEKSGYDQRVWPELSRDIERNRLSDRSRLSG
jgi:hypothetical protein